ncbi:6-bladed beta-propeller [Viscerimonas tarda]
MKNYQIMRHLTKLLCVLFTMVCWGCAHDSETEKYQNSRKNVVNVREKVKEIEMEDVLIGQTARLFLIGDYLIIGDYKSLDKLIHIFDRETFTYVTSIADRGQGPHEITNMGHIETDESSRLFYVSDHGKQMILSYNLDSVLVNPSDVPHEKMKMNKGLFPDKYRYLNDTLSIGLIIEPIGNSDFSQIVAKWNMATGEIKPMKYKHPKIEKKRVNFAVSEDNGIYVECYTNHDLMTVCNFQGDLIHNIYGPDWSSQGNKTRYYGKVVFCNGKILASYSGGDRLSEERFPTKFHVFDINGDYLQTLETGLKICDFCYDKKTNRIIMNLDEEIQFAYLELDKLVE